MMSEASLFLNDSVTLLKVFCSMAYQISIISTIVPFAITPIMLDEKVI